jgi:hypothetical protein
MSAHIISGRVVESDGRLVAGASVMFTSGPVALPDIAQLTDAAGMFSLSAPAQGTYRIFVNAPETGTAERDVKVVRKGKVSVVIKLSPKK